MPDSNEYTEMLSLAKTIQTNIKDAKRKQKKWRDLAIKAYNFYAGHQWDETDLARLREDERPAITFNRTVRVVNAVSGLEIQNRQTVAYYPREQGDAISSELLTGAVSWVRDSCDAEDEESHAFKDCVICGMGWTETRLDYEVDPDGAIIEDRIDPLEMNWDPSATKANVDDAKWISRTRKFKLKEVKELWPDAEIFQVGQNVVMMDTPDIQEPIDVMEARFYRNDNSSVDFDKNEIEVVQYQWYERERFYRVQNGDDIESLSSEQFSKIKPLVDEMGLAWVKQTRRKYKQAFLLGDQVLEEGELPIDAFTLRAMTGLEDHINNYWFGLLQLMLDPQMYANKWLSQILYILNTNPSGGYFYETGAIKNLNRFKQDLSHPAKDVELNVGGLDKIQPKNPVSFPAGIDKLLNYAIESINDLVGVNLEMLGIANREQAGVLEETRKQAGVTILADFFDALRRFRKEQGRVLADFVIKYISDGRLVRIEGEDMAQYVPLFKDDFDFKYDIVVDDSPTSPNKKEKTFETLMAVLPQLLEAGIPMPPDLIDYLPIPADLAVKWKKLINQEPEPDQLEEFAKQIKMQLAQLEVQKQQQDLEKGQTDMAKKQADTTKTYAETELDIARTAREQALTSNDVAETQRKNLETVLDMVNNMQANGGMYAF